MRTLKPSCGENKSRKTDGPEDGELVGPRGAPWRDTWKHFVPNNGEGEFQGLGRKLGLKGAWSIHQAAGL